jgi:coatomer subunit beta'
LLSTLSPHDSEADRIAELKELALKVTTDPDHKFDLSLQLDDLDTALEIVKGVPELEAESKWKALGDRALAVWRFDIARESFEKAGDLSALMLLLLSIGDRDGLKVLAQKAGTYHHMFHSLYHIPNIESLTEEKELNNLAFVTLFQIGDVDACLDLLIKTHRTPEASLFTRTYAPRLVLDYLVPAASIPDTLTDHSRVHKAVDAWRSTLNSKNRSKIAQSVAHPAENADLFEEGWGDALQREKSGLLGQSGILHQ